MFTLAVCLKEYESPMYRPAFLRIALAFMGWLVVGLGPMVMAASDDAKQAAPAADQAKAQQGQEQSGDPLKRPISEKRRKENAKSLKRELSREHRKWLDEDVRWIITDDERKAFKQLSNDEERDKFIEAFWDRRNPNPDS